MWPSFSLCAWRILKIRSCLRRPLAPGISSVRAMRLSSVMFFSLSSEMVIFYLQVGCDGGVARKEVTDGEELLGKVFLRNLFLRNLFLRNLFLRDFARGS